MRLTWNVILSKVSLFSKEYSPLLLLIVVSTLAFVYLVGYHQPYPYVGFSDDAQFFNVAQNIAEGHGPYKNYMNNRAYGGDILKKVDTENLWEKSKPYPFPLYSFLLALPMVLVGDHIKGFQLFHFLIFQLILIFSYTITFQLTRNHWNSFLAGFLVASSPILLQFLNRSMPELLVILLFLSVYYFSLVKEGKTNYFLELFLFCLLGLLKRSYFIFFALIVARRLWQQGWRFTDETIRSVSLVLIPLTLLKVSKLLELQRYVGSYTTGFHNIHENINFLKKSSFYPSNFPYQQEYLLQSLIYLAILGALLTLLKRKYSSHIFLFSAFFLLNVGAILTFYHWHDYRHIRNLIWLYPLLPLLLMNFRLKNGNLISKKTALLLASIFFLINLPTNYHLLNQHIPKLKKQTEKKLKDIHKIRAKISKYFPQAKYFAVDSSDLMRFSFFDLDKYYSWQFRIKRRNRGAHILKLQRKRKELPHVLILREKWFKKTKLFDPYKELLDLENSKNLKLSGMNMSYLLIPLKGFTTH